MSSTPAGLPILTPRVMRALRAGLPDETAKLLEAALDRLLREFVEPVALSDEHAVVAALHRHAMRYARLRAELMQPMLALLAEPFFWDALVASADLAQETVLAEGWKIGAAASDLSAALEVMQQILSSTLDGLPDPQFERGSMLDLWLDGAELDICVIAVLAALDGDVSGASQSTLILLALRARLLVERIRDRIESIRQPRVDADRLAGLAALAGSWPHDAEIDVAVARVYSDRTRDR